MALLATALLFASTPLRAQDSNAFESPESFTEADEVEVPALEEVAPAPKPMVRTVEAVDVHFKQASNISEALVRSHIEMKVGDAFSQAALDRSVKALFATGFFDDVYVTPLEKTPGKMTLRFELTARLKIRTINFEGNKHLKDKKLLKAAELKPNQMLGTETLAEATRKIKAEYLKKNYPDAKIVSRTTPLVNAGLVDVTFVIDEGDKQKVTAINFIGNVHAKAKDLREIMATKKDSWISWLTGSGKIDDENTADDLRRITDYYRNRGFLEVKVTGPRATPYRDGQMLTYTIQEGPRLSVGEQSVTGNTIFTSEQIAQAFKLKKGEALSAAALDATSQSIRDLYGSKGYLETAVRSEMVPTSTPEVLDLKYTVRESPQYTVGTINISGNTTTKNIVVARELLLSPADTFSSTKMRTSEERLRNTGYFESVDLSHEPSALSEDTKDLNVAVTEGKTGNVTFGAGFGSLDHATVFTEFKQGNFDITNWRNFFRGGGQKLRLYLALSSRSNQAILNFEEPWLFQHRIAGGFSLYRAETEYLSTEYDERRTGTEWYLRKRLIELVDARLGYRFERVTIYDVDNDAAQVIQDEAGSRNVSKLTLNFSRDTRDQFAFATRGSRWELETAWAGHGLGGDTDYWSVEGRGAKYLRSFTWPLPQYVSILGRAGTMDGFNGERVPLFDRFFLGGPNTLRGFGYRKVGPKETLNNEPLGGKTYGFGSIEYTFQLAKPIQFAMFYDIGFLNSGTGDFDPSDYNDNYGFGLRILLMGAPLRIDYGIPLTTDSANDGGGRFWFSFGTRF